MDIGGNSAWTDYTFQVDIKMMSGSSFELGVFGRFALGSDKGNYYEAYMDDSGAVQLRVKLDGSTTTLGTKSKSTTGAAVLGMVYTFTLDLRGSTISVSVNGVPRVSMVMDSTLSAGGIGLIVNNGTAEFDNVVVTE
jgi:pectate lyase